MKILVISDLYPPNYIGGYELNCREAVDALAAKGHIVTVLTSSWGSNRKSVEGNIYRLLDFDSSLIESDGPGGSVHLNSLIKRFLQFRRVIISRKNYAVTRNTISRTRPEVVYLWHLYYLTISPALAAQDAGIPKCFRIEDYSLARIKRSVDERAPISKRIYRGLIYGKRDMDRLRPNNLLFISQFVKKYYLEAGFPEAGMEVISSGVPSSSPDNPSDHRTHPFAAGEGTIRLVFSGRVESEKGPDIAIEAIAKLKVLSPNRLVYLDVIGNGNPDFLEHLKQLAAQCGVEDRIVFLGKLDQQEVLKRFQSYDALLFTSRWQEPFGRVLIEAMAQGLPIIAARTGAVSEIISDSENGLLVRPDDPEALAAAIRKFIQIPDLAARLSQNALVTVRSRFTIEHVGACMEAYLSDVAKLGSITA